MLGPTQRFKDVCTFRLSLVYLLLPSSRSFFLGCPLAQTKCAGLNGCGPTMKIQIGILGLPNVGKSSLFNALAQQSIAQAENFPFCTIDPNIAPIAIPDPYLDRLGDFAGSSRKVAANLEWVDVAGLARGAHRGEGLGNRFLGNLRDCDALCHVVRTFQDTNVVVAQADGKVEPHKDIETIHLELLFTDIAHVERRLEKNNVPDEERVALEQVLETLNRGAPASCAGLTPEAKKSIKFMGLLTLKPIMYAFNVDEIDYVLDRDKMITHTIPKILQQVQYYEPATDRWAVVSARLENELGRTADKSDYMRSLGVDDVDSAMNNLSHKVLPALAMELLGLTMAYTGPGVPPERSRTTRAHIFTKGLTAEGLAGRIHGKIEKGFIRAEVTPASTLLSQENYVAAKESGLIRTEGRDYQLKRDDVVLVKWK